MNWEVLHHLRRLVCGWSDLLEISSWVEEEGAQRLILMVAKADNIWDVCKDRGSGSSQCLAPRQTLHS